MGDLPAQIEGYLLYTPQHHEAVGEVFLSIEVAHDVFSIFVFETFLQFLMDGPSPSFFYKISGKIF